MLLLLVLLFSLFNIGDAQGNFTEIFCSSKCASHVSACYGPNENQCYACSTSLYSINSNQGVCQTKLQHRNQFYELKNSAMDLTGYTTSKPQPQACSIYTVSGQYVAGDYIRKTFTSIPLNHYQIVIRFSVGYIGSWSQSDSMLLEVNGNTEKWEYNSCAYAQDLCSGSLIDCFKTKQFVISHDTSTLDLRFSSLITETDPLIKYWGIKDLLIGIRTCSTRCETCFGPGHADCSSCSSGFYLLGNLCVSECTVLAVQDKRICTEECPAGYFDNKNKLCQRCQKDCVICNSAGTCQVWDQNKEGLIWINNKPFWIFIIIIGSIVLLYIIWRCIIKKYFKSKFEGQSDINKKILCQSNAQSIQNKQQSSSSSDEKQKQNTQQINNTKSYINQIERRRVVNEDIKFEQTLDLNPIKIQKRKRKKARHLVFEERSDVNFQTSQVQLEVTNDKFK